MAVMGPKSVDGVLNGLHRLIAQLEQIDESKTSEVGRLDTAITDLASRSAGARKEVERARRVKGKIAELLA